jgi:hypothetical protein
MKNDRPKGGPFSFCRAQRIREERR